MKKEICFFLTTFPNPSFENSLYACIRFRKVIKKITARIAIRIVISC